jgi:hypothetical protein
MKVEKCEVHGFFKPDGSIIDSEKIKPFIPEKSKSSTQEDLDGEIIARDYSIKNIMMVRMLGEEYRIIHHISQVDEKVVEKETVAV